MRECELCKLPARTYCESDEASLCWDCDAKVHGANFLVARHTRTLLCHVCHSLTPWKASGGKLGHTAVSLCECCVNNGQDLEDEMSQEVNDDEEEEEGENQVVPWSAITTVTAPPPPTSSDSEEEDCVVVDNVFSLKRVRGNNSDLEDLNSCSCEERKCNTKSDSGEPECTKYVKRFRRERNEGDFSDVNSCGSCN